MIKPQLLLTVFLLVYGLGQSQGQNRSTIGAKVVIIIDGKSNKVSSIELVSRENEGGTLLRKYPNSKFCLGMLNGAYKMVQNGIIPTSGSTVTIYPTKEFLPGDQYLPGDRYLPVDQYLPGDPYLLGSVTTQVQSHKKGQMVVRVQ
ncbi:MAG: hypothetical protein KJN70_06260 [Eudoraea sp.]|nr:hypothetical protein [Eudoraea sp.]